MRRPPDQPVADGATAWLDAIDDNRAELAALHPTGPRADAAPAEAHEPGRIPDDLRALGLRRIAELREDLARRRQERDADRAAGRGS